ncbi:UNVERIFIED_ORG: hypothetical protein BDK47_11625 [Anoxybacillus amylolyticus]
MKKVNIPVFENVQENPSSALLNWYKSLGWDDEFQELDPKKVLISEEEWLAICRMYNEFHGTSGGFFFMSYGPACDKNIPQGKVFLQSGWVSRPADC